MITAEDRLQCEPSEIWVYGEWLLCVLQTESCCLHCQAGKDYVIQSSFNKAINFFSVSLAPEKNSSWIPPPSSWWYFDFSFPFPVYHSLIRSPHAVTCSIQFHLLKRPEMLLSIWNIVHTDCSLFQRGKHQCLLFRNQALAPGASHYLSSLEEKKNLQQGLLIPPLVCSAAAIQQNKIIPVAAYNLDFPMKWYKQRNMYFVE